MIFQKINRLFVFSLIALIISNCSQPQQIIPTETIQPTNTSTPTQEPTATITPTPLPEFDVCTIDNFRECEINEEELIGGDYFTWLKEVVAPTLAPEFQDRYLKGSMLFDSTPIVPHSFGQATYLSFETAISFANEEARPFMRNVTFAWHPSEREMPGVEIGYFVCPVFMYEVTNLETGDGIVYPIILVYLANDDMLPEIIEDYQTVNEPIFYTSTNYASGHEDPLIVESFFRKNNSSTQTMSKRFDRFSKGEYGALSESGILLNTSFLAGGSGWYTN